MIKAILFDLGGVYFEDGTKKFLQILSKKTGKSFDELYPIFREGKSLEYRKNIISGKEFFKWASKELNNALPSEKLNDLWVSQYTVIPGIKTLIKDLKAKGLKVTVLSDNVPERIEYLQNKYHFLELFDDVVLSYEVNLTKQSTDIFELTLKRINVKPEEAIFIDDRDKYFEVAKKVGIKSILFNSVSNLNQELEKLLK